MMRSLTQRGLDLEVKLEDFGDSRCTAVPNELAVPFLGREANLRCGEVSGPVDRQLAHLIERLALDVVDTPSVVGNEDGEVRLDFDPTCRDDVLEVAIEESAHDDTVGEDQELSRRRVRVVVEPQDRQALGSLASWARCRHSTARSAGLVDGSGCPRGRSVDEVADEFAFFTEESGERDHVLLDVRAETLIAYPLLADGVTIVAEEELEVSPVAH